MKKLILLAGAISVTAYAVQNPPASYSAQIILDT